MPIENYVFLLRMAGLRRIREHFEALRADLARSFGFEVSVIEGIRGFCAEELKITPPVFDNLLVVFARNEFARGLTLGEVCAEFSGKDEIPYELYKVIRESPQVPDHVSQDRELLHGSIDRLPALISDALLRASRNSVTLGQLPLDASRELGAYRRSILIVACVLLLLLAGAVYLSYSHLTRTQSLEASRPLQGGRSTGDEDSGFSGPGVSLRTDGGGQKTPSAPTDKEMQQALQDARSSLHSALRLHFVGAGLLVVGLALVSTAKRHSKTKIAGVAMSLLGGLTLFPIKEFKAIDKLAEKFEINIGRRGATSVTSQEFQMEQDCTVEPFHGAGADTDDPNVQPSLQACSEGIRERLYKQWGIAFMVLVGHADKRNLSSSQQAHFGSNEALAYRRALAVKTYLLQMLAATPNLESHMIVMSSGAGNVGRSVPADALAKDRRVDVHVYWVRPPGAP